MEQINTPLLYPSNKYPESGQDTTVRLFAQLSWYFRREWRRYLGLSPCLSLSRCCNWFRQKWLDCCRWRNRTTLYYRADPDVDATMVLIAVVVYLLRYVWRVFCLVRLINWLLNCVKIITVS